MRSDGVQCVCLCKCFVAKIIKISNSFIFLYMVSEEGEIDTFKRESTKVAYKEYISINYYLTTRERINPKMQHLN